MTNDAASAIAVFTADTVDAVLSNSGSGDWVISPAKASQCRYLVCCRKQSWSNRRDGVANGAAFLIGIISGLRERAESRNERGQSRYLIEISEFALIDRPGAWKEGRNPVAYKSLKELGIDVRSLKFKPLGVPSNPSNARSTTVPTGMTIVEAKKGLAITFGVKPEDIEITIRG
jgi:hypothetical protein